MASFAELLGQLLETGCVVFREPPSFEQRGSATALLQRAFAGYRLQVAGPPLEFQADCALRAAEVLLSACWFLVHRDESPQKVERCLTLSAPQTPAEHLSGDLLLRYLPQVQRRAKAVAANDPLCERLALLLRQWPLSGVLADVHDAPLTPPEFDGHAGLALLYAERLARHFKTEWLPSGRGLDYFELVWQDLGKGTLPYAPVGNEAKSPREDEDVAS
jgi:hypothetical protein